MDILVMGLATGLANEAIFVLKQKMKSVLSSIFGKLKESEEHRGLIASYKQFMGSFMAQEDISTKRAGILMLDCFLMENAIKMDKSLVKAIEACVSIVGSEEANVKQFYEDLKEEKELREKLDNSAWKSIALKEGTTK